MRKYLGFYHKILRLGTSIEKSEIYNQRVLLINYLSFWLSIMALGFILMLSFERDIKIIRFFIFLILFCFAPTVYLNYLGKVKFSLWYFYVILNITICIISYINIDRSYFMNSHVVFIGVSAIGLFLFDKKSMIVAFSIVLGLYFLNWYFQYQKLFLDLGVPFRQFTTPLTSFVVLLIVFRYYKQVRNDSERVISAQNRKLEEQKERLQEHDRLKSKIFANISHEFRTPITLIQGPLEKLLEENKENVKVDSKQLRRMFRNSKRLQHLVNQMLDLVRLDVGNLRINIIYGDLIYFLSHLANSFSPQAELREIQYNVNTPSYTGKLPFDQDIVEKITYNLLVNAFKFTPQYGQIQYSIELLNMEKKLFQEQDNEVPYYIKMAVTDSGEGIHSSEINKVFDSFTKTHTNNNEGVGVGLSLVKELVELYDGQLEVESKPGTGTSFKVVLPIHDSLLENAIISKLRDNEFVERLQPRIDIDQLMPAEKPEQKDTKTKKGAPTILLIEDNIDVREYIVESLEDAKYNVITSKNGIEGLKKVKEQTPNLIITDIAMPEMDGFELLTQLKRDEDTASIPVIILTAKADEASKLQGLEYGADAFMVKPYSEKELLVRIKKLTGDRST